MAKKLKWNLILMSLLYLALGIFLLMVPGTALNVVCCALGGVVLACACIFLPQRCWRSRGLRDLPMRQLWDRQRCLFQ